MYVYVYHIYISMNYAHLKLYNQLEDLSMVNSYLLSLITS